MSGKFCSSKLAALKFARVSSQQLIQAYPQSAMGLNI
jgi:hypothetical protein